MFIHNKNSENSKTGQLPQVDVKKIYKTPLVNIVDALRSEKYEEKEYLD